ncbi:Zinc transporter ZIP1 [Dirofilaria immitis]
MANEVITVRMNRSNSTIPWGFTVAGGSPMPITISTVQKESLADKAGLQTGDTITEFSGRTTKGMTLQEARNIIEKVSLEIHMLLQRQVTEHSCLPWQLTEKDNQITVDYIKPGKVANYNYYKTERKDVSRSTSNYKVPITNESAKYHTSTYSKHEDNYSTDNYRAESRSTSGYGSADKPTSGISRNVPIVLGNSVPSSTKLISPTAKTTDPENKSYGPVHVDTSNVQSNVGYSPSSGFGSGHQPAGNTPQKTVWHDSGPRTLFQHSPRTERQLSPHATIRHLQYNSPMNLYSPQSAAEQYAQQTGGIFSTDPSLQRPKGDEAYLKSETRRLIAEEEGQTVHDKSPSMQSASFKRISRACVIDGIYQEYFQKLSSNNQIFRSIIVKTVFIVSVNKMSILLAKIVMLITMGIFALLFGLLPTKIYKYVKVQQIIKSSKEKLAIRFLSILSCFSGGVFLGVCLLDLLPTANKAFDQIKQQNGMETNYPYMEVLIGCGFFIIYLIEVLSIYICGQNHIHYGTNSMEKKDRNGQQNENNDNQMKKKQINVSAEELDISIKDNYVKSLSLVAAIAVHSCLEGFTFGIQYTMFSVTTLFLGIIVHKSLIAFSIGMNLIKAHPNKIYFVILLIIFVALMSPVGGLIGIALKDAKIDEQSQNAVTAIASSLANGTFIYITFFEILFPEQRCTERKMEQWLSTTKTVMCATELQNSEGYN